MNRHQPDDQRHGDIALDHVINAAMSGILAKLEEAFDPEAGLADIRARRAVAAPAAVAHRPSGAGSSRLEQACDQIDLLTAWLANLISSGQQEPFAGSSFLELARDNLVQLRAGLAARTMARPEAQRLTTDVHDQVARADQILRSQHATTLDRIASDEPGHTGSLADHVEALRQLVTRLYEPDADDVSLQPAR
jgi:hypothetical protein